MYGVTPGSTHIPCDLGRYFIFRWDLSVALLPWGIQECGKCQWTLYWLHIESAICVRYQRFNLYIQIFSKRICKLSRKDWSNLVKLELQSLLKWHHSSWHNMLVGKSDWKLNWCFVSRSFAERTTYKNTDFQSLGNEKINTNEEFSQEIWGEKKSYTINSLYMINSWSGVSCTLEVNFFKRKCTVSLRQKHRFILF